MRGNSYSSKYRNQKFLRGSFWLHYTIFDHSSCFLQIMKDQLPIIQSDLFNYCSQEKKPSSEKKTSNKLEIS